jgi:hypothetical protein
VRRNSDEKLQAHPREPRPGRPALHAAGRRPGSAGRQGQGRRAGAGEGCHHRHPCVHRSLAGHQTRRLGQRRGHHGRGRGQDARQEPRRLAAAPAWRGRAHRLRRGREGGHARHQPGHDADPVQRPHGQRWRLVCLGPDLQQPIHVAEPDAQLGAELGHRLQDLAGQYPGRRPGRHRQRDDAQAAGRQGALRRRRQRGRRARHAAQQDQPAGQRQPELEERRRSPGRHRTGVRREALCAPRFGLALRLWRQQRLGRHQHGDDARHHRRFAGRQRLHGGRPERRATAGQHVHRVCRGGARPQGRHAVGAVATHAEHRPGPDGLPVEDELRQLRPADLGRHLLHAGGQGRTLRRRHGHLAEHQLQRPAGVRVHPQPQDRRGDDDLRPQDQGAARRHGGLRQRHDAAVHRQLRGLLSQRRQRQQRLHRPGCQDQAQQRPDGEGPVQHHARRGHDRPGPRHHLRPLRHRSHLRAAGRQRGAEMGLPERRRRQQAGAQRGWQRLFADLACRRAT